ncbi:MAG TPA: S9 family peptidase [Myxococcales bacterium]|jgi:dipeptidyl aminopeptidase/acylaminoacyl peptidase
MANTAKLAAALFVFLASAVASAEQRPMREKDLWQFTWVGDPQVSPDGAQAVFARIVVDQKRLGYETSLWVVGTRGGSAPRRLTSGTHDGQPRWSPDGRSIAFVRSLEKDGKPQEPQLFVLSMTGGEPQQITDLPKGASDPRWSPDGRRIAFHSSTNADDLRKKAKGEKSQPAQTTPSVPQAAPPSEPGKPTPESESTKPAGQEGREPLPTDEVEHESDVKVITRGVYRANGQGYLDFAHPAHLWVISAPAGSDDKPQPLQVTSGKFDEDDFFWSNDGKELVYTTTRSEEPWYEAPHTEIYAVPAAGGQPRLVNAVKLGVEEMAPSPDGKRIAFRAQLNTEPVRSYQQPDLFVLELSLNAQPKNLSADFDNDVGGGIGGDSAPPRAGGGTHPIWTPDGRSLVDVVTIEGRANLMKFPLDGQKPNPVTRGDIAVERFSMGKDGTLVTLVSTPMVIGDLMVLGDRGQLARLTAFNDKLFSQIRLSPPEEIWYRSFDGRKIQAWVQKPPDFNPSKKYPLILNIHGGPHTAYGYVFDHEFQWMAARGYVVLYPNPRGSTSYGQEFGNVIQYKYPGDDFKDLMAGVDELLRRGYVDEHRMGVTGGSGGGVLTNWTVTHTNRFRAAVSQRDISDWAAWWYTDDFWLYRANWFRKPPFEDPKEYAERSALTYVENIHTPIAFILGDADYRTPPGAGGEALFRALKDLKRPTAMVRFPGESHELSRSGQPWHRVERLEAIVGWFDKFMLGEDVPMFRDVARAGEGERRAQNQ